MLKGAEDDPIVCTPTFDSDHQKRLLFVINFTQSDFPLSLVGDRMAAAAQPVTF